MTELLLKLRQSELWNLCFNHYSILLRVVMCPGMVPIGGSTSKYHFEEVLLILRTTVAQLSPVSFGHSAALGFFRLICNFLWQSSWVTLRSSKIELITAWASAQF